MVTLVQLTNYFAFPLGRRAGEQCASSLWASGEGLSTDGVSFAFVGFKEVKDQLNLAFADHVNGKNAGVSDVGVGTGVALDANGHPRRRKDV